VKFKGVTTVVSLTVAVSTMGGWVSSMFSPAARDGAQSKGLCVQISKDEFTEFAPAPQAIKSAFVRDWGFGVVYKPPRDKREQCEVTGMDLYHVRLDFPREAKRYYLKCTSRWLHKTSENRHFIGTLEKTAVMTGKLGHFDDGTLLVLYFASPVLNLDDVVKSELSCMPLERLGVDANLDKRLLVKMHKEGELLCKSGVNVPLKEMQLYPNIFGRRPAPSAPQDENVPQPGDMARGKARLSLIGHTSDATTAAVVETSDALVKKKKKKKKMVVPPNYIRATAEAFDYSENSDCVVTSQEAVAAEEEAHGVVTSINDEQSNYGCVYTYESKSASTRSSSSSSSSSGSSDTVSQPIELRTAENSRVYITASSDTI
jgi:hypothetical protein